MFYTLHISVSDDKDCVTKTHQPCSIETITKKDAVTDAEIELVTEAFKAQILSF